MRIITGRLKGRKINIPKTLDVRPTTDRVKEGIFSVIESYRVIPESIVLDLFAGSGNLGFETLSRGAHSAFFVDHNQANIKHIEKVAQEFELSESVRSATFDVKQFLEGPPVPADIIFSDPPYKYPHIEETTEAILSGGWLNPNGWLILEHSTYLDFRDHPNCLKTKRYGRTVVNFFEQKA
ncbi:MAG TPA: 16S rRNA (guanine(966)-N(2))-methyltransferase RsmD [Balneolaceae bacterium]|nr:16S rRNA (guanine(966)-N(2))-methyltransferase RsmD [Balneolaceae bacterium]